MASDKTSVSRRKMLATIGSASAIGLAGCSGGGGSGGDGGNGGDSSKTSTPVQYPTEDIQLTVPYATGGGFDAYSRLSKPYWQKYLPKDPTVTVKNVVGGGGVKGATQTYNAEPDGHSFMIWDAVQAVTQQIGRDVGYDISKMSHIGALTQAPNCLITMKGSGIKNWNDLVNNISEINFATQGVGAISHVGVVLLGELTGAWSADDINFVHYGGTGPALSGLKRGEASVFLPGTATSGLKVVKALDAQMAILFSDEVSEDSIYHGVPLQYSGNLDVKKIDQYADLTVFRRFFTGPPGVPEEVLQIQRDAFNKIINDEELLQKAKEKGRPIVDPGSAKEVEKVIQKQFETFGSEPMKSIIKGAFQS